MERPSQFIECGGLVLRRWRPQDDFTPAFRLIEESVDHLRPWMGWVARHGEETTRDFLAKAESKWAADEAYNYAIAEGGTLVGMCQTYRVEAPARWRMGYWLHPAATGRGIATRATAALVAEMFALPGVEYVEITHDLANTASGRVPRRLGFTEIGHERTLPETPSLVGVDVVWRLDRPGTPADGTTAR
ncbi:GNAT family N-acetyltransferase [Streptomyces sp. MAI_2237]